MRKFITFLFYLVWQRLSSEPTGTNRTELVSLAVLKRVYAPKQNEEALKISPINAFVINR